MSESHLIGVSAETWAFVSRPCELTHHEIGAAINNAFDDLTERIGAAVCARAERRAPGITIATAAG